MRDYCTFHYSFGYNMDGSDTDDDYESMNESPILPSNSNKSNLLYSEMCFSQPTSAAPKPLKGLVNSEENPVVYSAVRFNDGDYENVTDRSNLDGSDTDTDTATSDDYILMNDAPEVPTKFAEKGPQKKGTPQYGDSFAGDYCRLLNSKAHGRSPKAMKRTKKKDRREMLQVTDITTLEDRRIVLTTFCGKIIVLNPDGAYLFTENFYAVFDKCTSISRDEIAVSCGFQVRFFSVHDMDVIEEKEKCLDYQYDSTTVHGISYKGQSLLMSCNLQTVDSSQSPELKLVDMKRRSTKTISCSRFKFPGVVLLNSDCKIIFVADQINQTVTSLDDNGNVLWEKIEAKNPTSLTLANDILAVAYEKFSRIKCFSATNGDFLRGIEMAVGVSNNACLTNNLSEIIICASDHPVGEMFDFVVFAPLKYVRKRSLTSKLSKLWFH